MSTTRAEVLHALRQWGAPVAPVTLANWMNRSPIRVGEVLATLYHTDRADRRPCLDRNRGQRGPAGHLYTAKELQS